MGRLRTGRQSGGHRIGHPMGKIVTGCLLRRLGTGRLSIGLGIDCLLNELGIGKRLGAPGFQAGF